MTAGVETAEGNAPVKTSLFYLPSIGSRAEIEAGMAGLRGDLYTRMLAELSGQARLADELGYDSISFTEHHFQIEGMELSNNPVLLDLYIAMQTKRIRVGQLGIVLPAENPLRVAANRAAFEENFRLIRKCWTEDFIAFDGTYWKVPADGTPWRLPATDMFGGGVEDGIVKAVAVVPKPLQKPHPPLFQPFASSEASIRWCAQEGVTAILPPLHRKTERRLYEVYAATSGRALGDGVGILRDLVIADTDAEAQALWENSSRFAAKVWFEPFGFRRGMVDPDDGSMPSPEEFLRDGYTLVGSVDTVCRQLEAAASRVPLDWLFCWMFNGMIPHEKLMRTIELFATQVLPRFGVKPAA